MSLKLNADKVPYVDLGGGIHIELDLSEYDDDKLCVEKAREELRETPEIVEASLKQLRELLKGEWVKSQCRYFFGVDVFVK